MVYHLIYTDVNSHKLPQLHKLPSNLTQDKYSYGMCAQVLLTYVGVEERHCLGYDISTLYCIQCCVCCSHRYSNTVFHYTTIEQHNTDMLSNTSAFITLRDTRYSKITRKR
jgi:hypothetical protein